MRHTRPPFLTALYRQVAVTTSVTSVSLVSSTPERPQQPTTMSRRVSSLALLACFLSFACVPPAHWQVTAQQGQTSVSSLVLYNDTNCSVAYSSTQYNIADVYAPVPYPGCFSNSQYPPFLSLSVYAYFTPTYDMLQVGYYSNLALADNTCDNSAYTYLLVTGAGGNATGNTCWRTGMYAAARSPHSPLCSSPHLSLPRLHSPLPALSGDAQVSHRRQPDHRHPRSGHALRRSDHRSHLRVHLQLSCLHSLPSPPSPGGRDNVVLAISANCAHVRGACVCFVFRCREGHASSAEESSRCMSRTGRSRVFTSCTGDKARMNHFYAACSRQNAHRQTMRELETVR